LDRGSFAGERLSETYFDGLCHADQRVKQAKRLDVGLDPLAMLEVCGEVGDSEDDGRKDESRADCDQECHDDQCEGQQAIDDREADGIGKRRQKKIGKIARIALPQRPKGQLQVGPKVLILGETDDRLLEALEILDGSGHRSQPVVENLLAGSGRGPVEEGEDLVHVEIAPGPLVNHRIPLQSLTELVIDGDLVHRRR